MSGTNGNGRIHILGQEMTQKQAEKMGKMYCTRDEATEIAREVAIRVHEHYMNQVPALVGTIVEAALRAYDESVRISITTTPEQNQARETSDGDGKPDAG